ncbi:MAG: UxaA family hydrolase [Clostridia bacterium]
MINAMIIDEKDDVIVAIEPIKQGDEIFYKINDEEFSLKALEDIIIYHKVAIRDILKDTPINKYGEHIGVASRDVKKGEHMHTHNISERRENLKV